MAMTRVLSTLMPAALATTRFWPTARNCWPRRVFMIITLNRQRMPTTRKVTTGTLTRKKISLTAGNCTAMTQAASTATTTTRRRSGMLLRR